MGEIKMPRATKTCPDCLGKVVNGKCTSCGWTPTWAKVWKKYNELGI